MSAASNERSWEQWRRYGEAFRRDAHQLLAWGYGDARAEFRAHHDETDITGLIVREMSARLDSDETDPRFDRYSVTDDTPQEGQGRKGRHRRRVDILLVRTGTRPRIKYILEAKRLSRGTHPLRVYLGDDGMRRFTQGVYAAHALEVAMVGFVQSPTVDDWAAELTTTLAGPQRASFKVKTGLDPLAMLPGLSHRWTGIHTREKGPDIIICHILLDCIVAPAAT